MTDTASALKAAEAALGKGDYNCCIKIIEPLLLSFSAETTIGAQLRLLEITAHIGRGDEKKAINICKSLVNNKEETIRQQVKQLLSILDAPSLPRPSNWSVKIPKIEIEQSLKSSFSKTRKQTKKSTYPPTGPTRNLDYGFSIITLLIIILITIFLSGCVDISTNLSINSADSLDISLDIESNSGKSIPWQIEFTNNLTKTHSIFKKQIEGNKHHFESPAIHFDEANELLQVITSAASKASGFNINKPEIIVTNKNWIIGTRQDLKFYFNLSAIPKIPGLRMNIILNNFNNEHNFKTKPLKPTFKQNSLSLPLQIGEINQLEVSYWKWNKISVGIILIIILTFLSKFLQTFRLKMGFGFPELPP